MVCRGIVTLPDNLNESVTEGDNRRAVIWQVSLGPAPDRRVTKPMRHNALA
jgi:hypothetical protein